MDIRPEQTEDRAAVQAIHESAFGQRTEGDLVDALRAACPEATGLVAVRGGELVGHLFFSPVRIDEKISGMGLAPMAVRPDCQRQGIGSALIEAGLALMREQDQPFVIVLGHPEYYPRFGFEPAAKHGIACPWEGIPDEVFMVLVLDEAAMRGITGTARYRAEFDQAL